MLKISRFVENVYVSHVENHVEVQKKPMSQFTVHVENNQQI